MTPTPTGGKVCSQSGLWIVPARAEKSFRVAKDRYGALAVRKNTLVGPPPMGTDPSQGDQRGRFDTIGSTIYLADSRRCAYAEVLGGFRQERSALAKVATSIGWNVDEYIAKVIEEAKANGVDVPWSIAVDWQFDRSIYEIRLPGSGWWVQIDHASTLSALERMAPKVPGLAEQQLLLTAGHINGEDRDLTTLLAHTIRNSMLEDGSEPLGISFASKSLMGRCWAFWDRRTDEGLSPGRNDLLQLTAENVGPDQEFKAVAEHYQLPILGTRASSR